MLFYVRDRKNIISRKPVDIVPKENTKATAGSNITNVVLKQLSKECEDNGSVGNRSVAAGSAAAVNRKDPPSFGASEEILQKEALNRATVSECLVRKSDTDAEPPVSPLPKNLSKGGHPNPDLEHSFPSSAPSVKRNSNTAKVDNSIVNVRSDCREFSSDSKEPQNSPIEKLVKDEAPEKVTGCFTPSMNFVLVPTLVLICEFLGPSRSITS